MGYSVGSSHSSDDESKASIQRRRLRGTTVSPINVSELPPRETISDPAMAIPEPNEIVIPNLGKYHTKPGDFDILEELGSGNGGTVYVVLHKPSQYKMALKSIQLNADDNVYKQIHRELKIMHQCSSNYIVSFHGALIGDGEVSLCMEHMNVGSLDQIVKAIGPIPEQILGKTTYAVLSGLVYLYTKHKIIHRDVKPSNILLDSKGNIKISDFGVSVQLIDSIAQTFVGTGAYMSPERIQGSKYSVRSDAWSVGITLMELALGRFPFTLEGEQFGVFDLLELIVKEPSPTLPENVFAKDFEEFVARCLIKDSAQRPSPLELLSDPYCVRVSKEKVNVACWVLDIKDKLASK